MSEKNYWTSLRQRKISRRTMLKASGRAGVGAAGLALVGCGDDDDDDDAATAATEQAEEQAQAQATEQAQTEEEAQAQATEQAQTEEEAEPQAEAQAEQAEEQAEEVQAQAEEAEEAEFSVPWPLDQVDLDASIVAGISSRQEGTDMHRAGSQGNFYSHAAVFNAAMEIDPADGSAIPSLTTPEWIDPVSLRATVEPAPFHDGSILTAHDMVFSYDRMGGRAEYHQGGETTDHPGGWTPTNPTRGPSPGSGTRRWTTAPGRSSWQGPMGVFSPSTWLASSMPSSCRRTSRLCSPKQGAGLGAGIAASPMRQGPTGMRCVPDSGCVTGCRYSRARNCGCGSAKTSRMARARAAWTPRSPRSDSAWSAS